MSRATSQESTSATSASTPGKDRRLLWPLLVGFTGLTGFLALRTRRAASSSSPVAAPTSPAQGYRNTPFWRIFDGASQWVDQHKGWDKLPTPLGILVLVGLRNILRQKNLYDTTAEPTTTPPSVEPFDPAVLVSRNPDGSYNSLESPAMGMAGSRFGRNVPLAETQPETEPALLSPNPRTVSRQLMVRDTFIPATTLNVLAASWIQFMVKDWFSHGPGDPAHTWHIPLPPGDPWPQPPLAILKTLPDSTRPAASTSPPTFINTETHWWDGSQIYGNTLDSQNLRRSHRSGKLVLDDKGLLVFPQDPLVSPAMVPGWWLGLNMMATLFVREHNAICDALAGQYPTWSDEDLFQRARIVNAALMAKIHTVEWTPAIINHPTTVAGLRANWWGLASETVRKTFGRISNNEVISGIPGSEVDHYGVPYALTEEFTIVYRMHPLAPDDYELRSAASDALLGTKNLREVSGAGAQEVTAEVAMGDLFYSFGTAHPGAIVLHNFPKFLQEFKRPDNDILMDIAATDILRSRELGVPRYNRFRRLLHLKPAATFEELTGGDIKLATEIAGVYDNDIERVDLIVGMFAEPRPKGFAFSDTAFRIFIVMASRRLNSDRFLAADFTADVYTPVGMDWVQNNTLISVLLRHYPQLRPALHGVENGFQPWRRVVA
ncbi:MAG: peroxidase [Actinomycetota bacterium]